MLNKSEEKRNQIQMFCIEDLVPKDHLLRCTTASGAWASAKNFCMRQSGIDRKLKLPKLTAQIFRAV